MLFLHRRIILYRTTSNKWVPSDVYRYSDLLAALRVMYSDGIANKFFYMGDGSSNGHLYGLVNIAAFLAQSMKETIQYNACDKNSWDLVNGRYALSNAYGQLGQSYQDYKCLASEAHMECPVKRDMEITATTNAKWYGAPGPLFCGPKESIHLQAFGVAPKNVTDHGLTIQKHVTFMKMNLLGVLTVPPHSQTALAVRMLRDANFGEDAPFRQQRVY